MEENELLKETTVYKDNKGAGRLYIPKEVLAELGWENKQSMFLKTDGEKLLVAPETAVEVTEG